MRIQRLWTVLWPVIVAGVVAGVEAQAQNAACYTLESLNGSYASLTMMGTDVGMALQAERLDGKGNLTRTGPFNQPVAGSAAGQRTVPTVTSEGTYKVNCDGSGTITRIVSRPDGSKAQAYDDFLITESFVSDGKLMAKRFVDVQQVPSVILPGGVFLTRVHTWRPDTPRTGCYTLESLKGSYGVVNYYGAALAMGIQAETLDGKGNLNRTGILNQPKAGSTTGERTVGTVTSAGTYTVNCDGTGTIARIVTRPDGSKAAAYDDFIITQAVAKDGRLTATEIADAQRDPSVILPDGIFLHRTHTLRESLLLPDTPPVQPPAQVQTVAVANPKNVTVISSSIQLDGTKSTSADGKALAYRWTIPAGSPQAAILQGTSATPTVQFSQGRTTYRFQLTVTDSAGKTSTDEAVVNYQGN
ncbi:MAG: hypothetical protein HY821_05545 [Acidobacteria bacterium]|nr:hypothetical protein [Acidobacteriota bacterium]